MQPPVHAAFLIVLVTLGCRHKGPSNQELLWRWQTCIECNDGELDSIRALARRDSSALRVLVGSGAITGASDSTQEAMRARFRTSYNLVHDSANSQKREQYVVRYLDNFNRMWRRRSARVLVMLGDSSAAIDSALVASALVARP